MNPTDDIQAHEAEQIKTSYKSVDIELPDAEIDLKILNAAKIALNEDELSKDDMATTSIKKDNKTRNIFLIPLSLAASLMICISVVIYIDESQLTLNNTMPEYQSSEELSETEIDSVMQKDKQNILISRKRSLNEKVALSTNAEQALPPKAISKEYSYKKSMTDTDSIAESINMGTVKKESKTAAAHTLKPQDIKPQAQSVPKTSPISKQKTAPVESAKKDRSNIASDITNVETQSNAFSEQRTVSEKDTLTTKPREESKTKLEKNTQTPTNYSSMDTTQFSSKQALSGKLVDHKLTKVQIAELATILELLNKNDATAAELELYKFNKKYGFTNEIELDQIKRIIKSQLLR